jgi:hypothetical protein
MSSYRVDGAHHHRSLLGFIVGMAVAFFLIGAGWISLLLLAAFQ